MLEITSNDVSLLNGEPSNEPSPVLPTRSGLPFGWMEDSFCASGFGIAAVGGQQSFVTHARMWDCQGEFLLRASDVLTFGACQRDGLTAAQTAAYAVCGLSPRSLRKPAGLENGGPRHLTWPRRAFTLRRHGPGSA